MQDSFREPDPDGSEAAQPARTFSFGAGALDVSAVHHNMIAARTPPARQPEHAYNLPAPDTEHVYSQPPGDDTTHTTRDEDEDSIMETRAIPSAARLTTTTIYGSGFAQHPQDDAPRAGTALTGVYVAKFDLTGTDDGEASFKVCDVLYSAVLMDLCSAATRLSTCA